MVVASLLDLHRVLPDLAYPLLVLGMHRGAPYCAARADKEQELMMVAEGVLMASPTTSIVITGMDGESPRAKK